MVIWLCLALAWSQEEPPPDPPGQEAPEQEAPAEEQASEDDTDAEAQVEYTREEGEYTVIVFSELQLRQAREALMGKAADVGYTRVIEKGDRTIMRHELPWRGDLVMYDDGRVEVKRQPIRFEAPGDQAKKTNWLWCALLVPCLRPAGQLVSQRKFSAYQRSLMEGISGELHVFEARLADYGLGQKLDELPDALQDLWDKGIPLDGGPRLESVAERKVALLSYWDTRTETAWGDAVRQTVEAFILGVVQQSDTPLTESEVAGFNQHRKGIRPFDLQARTQIRRDPGHEDTP